jgi:hypothetical protein
MKFPADQTGNTLLEIFSTHQQQAVPKDVAVIPDAPTKVAELFKMFEAVAKTVVGNVAATKTPPPPKGPQFETPPLDSLQAFEAPQFDSVQAHDLPMNAQAVAAGKLEAKVDVSATAGAMKSLLTPAAFEALQQLIYLGQHHSLQAPSLSKQDASDTAVAFPEGMLTPAALAAHKKKGEAALKKGKVSPEVSVQQWKPPSTWATLTASLAKLGFTSNLPEALIQHGAPPEVVAAVCGLVLMNTHQVVKQAQLAATEEVVDAKKLVAAMQASKNDAAAQSSAWQSQHDNVLKELQAEKVLLAEAKNTLAAWEHLHAGLQKELTKSEAKAAALQEHLYQTLASKPAFVPPISVEGAFEGIAQTFRDVWKARAYYVELAVGKLMEEDEKAPVWPTLPVSWDVGYGCPGCSANKTMVGVSHPKRGNGYTCTKCKKTWKDPNAPSLSNKGLFDRINAVKLLVGELGYDLDMALYLVDTAGATGVLHIAQQVPVVSTPYATELQAWVAEQSGAALKKVEPFSLVTGSPQVLHPTQFTVDQVKIDALEASIKEETFGLLAYNVHDELVSVAALKESNPNLAKIASELLLQQQDAPESPLIAAATPLEVASEFFLAHSGAGSVSGVAQGSAYVLDASLDALALIPTVSKKKSK